MRHAAIYFKKTFLGKVLTLLCSRLVGDVSSKKLLYTQTSYAQHRSSRPLYCEINFWTRNWDWTCIIQAILRVYSRPV